MIRSILLILLCSALASDCCGQNFFWSTSGFGEGAVNDDFHFSGALPGQPFTVFLYYDAAGQQNITEGIDLDFSWSNPGVINFTAAQTLDFEIKISGQPVGERWGDFAGPAESVTPDSVTGFLTVNVVNGTGIQVANIPPGSPFIDDGYDQTAEAFLVGTFNAEIAGVGATEIVIDSSLVVDEGVNQALPFRRFVFVVPEPAMTFTLVLCLGVLSVSRRR